MQVALTPPKEVAILASERKPKFLDDLENFLNRELQSLGVETVQPNETRLQVSIWELSAPHTHTTDHCVPTDSHSHIQQLNWYKLSNYVLSLLEKDSATHCLCPIKGIEVF